MGGDSRDELGRSRDGNSKELSFMRGGGMSSIEHLKWESQDKSALKNTFLGQDSQISANGCDFGVSKRRNS